MNTSSEDQKLAVLMVTAGKPDSLQATLESLSQCELPTSLDKTYVVENGATQFGQSVVQQADPALKTHYLYSAEAGKCRALNKAIESIPDDHLVVMTDNDIRFSPQWLVAYDAAARECGSGHFFAGPTSVDYEAPPPEWLVPLLPYSARGKQWTDEEVATGRPPFLGFNWAVYAGYLKRAGLFDPRIGPGSKLCCVGDENDMQLRLRASGVKARYVPEALVWHQVPASKCSAEWLLGRSWHDGRSHGYHDAGAGVMRILGMSPRQAGRAIKAYLRLMLGSKLSQADEVSLRRQLRLLLSWHKGAWLRLLTRP